MQHNRKFLFLVFVAFLCFNFISFGGDPRECRGYVAFPLRDSRKGIARFPVHILDLRIFSYLGYHCLPLLLLSVSWKMGQLRRSYNLCLQKSYTQELQTINSKGVDWVARAAVEVLDRIKEASVGKEEWLKQLQEATGLTGDASELFKATSAFEAAHAQKIDIR